MNILVTMVTWRQIVATKRYPSQLIGEFFAFPCVKRPFHECESIPVQLKYCTEFGKVIYNSVDCLHIRDNGWYMTPHLGCVVGGRTEIHASISL
jgi:hypothetical protein